jgi:hypothetical protein
MERSEVDKLVNLRMAEHAIRDGRIYVEPIEGGVGSQKSYGFSICRVRDSEPIFTSRSCDYGSEEAALRQGYLVALETQAPGRSLE